ncbi:PadR family transcriptional regulator [Nocardia sp. NBC_01327]|uniref:PadR family transcriptional regulator n=1 Tax=Nocardia sp. NBC_01327 TaxID=2903593 RepID=UPI002E0ECF37|nr:helix-turn-helix transcriptional regulator [Nocardia sp. NBC_01327]
MSAEVLKGHLDGMILAVLADGPRHGYGVIDALRTRTGGRFDLPKGTIYPALHRLEQAGLIDGAWSREGGRQRRTYTLSLAGHRQLGQERASWRDFVAAVGALMEGNAVMGEEPWPAL